MNDNIFRELIEARRVAAQKEEEVLHYMARKLDTMDDIIKRVDQLLEEIHALEPRDTNISGPNSK